MTLVIALGNEDQFIQLSDRRLTAGKSIRSEEADKAAIFTCANARLAVGFSGLAEAGDFRTRDWLLDQLLNCAPPDYLAFETLGRFRDAMDRAFSSDSRLSISPRQSLRLSVMFCGYLYHHTPPLAVSALISNCQDFEAGVDIVEPWAHFKSTYLREKRPCHEPVTYVQRIGMWPAMGHAEVAALRSMLEKRLPAHAIVQKGVQLIRALAEKPESQGSIGKQVSSIIIPRDPQQPVSTDYHTDHPSTELFLPSAVVAIGTGRSSAFKDATVSITQPSGRPGFVAVPKVRSNQPCPCGSGRKYKNCHGREAVRTHRKAPR